MSPSGRTSPQRTISPRKNSRVAVSLTPDQIAEYKKQAQEYYSQAKGEVRNVTFIYFSPVYYCNDIDVLTPV